MLVSSSTNNKFEAAPTIVTAKDFADTKRKAYKDNNPFVTLSEL